MNPSHPDKVADRIAGAIVDLCYTKSRNRWSARLMELDPHFCDVIIARWEKLTGKKAVRISGAE